VRLAEYTQPWSRIVQDAKFTKWPRLSVDLGRLLGRQLITAMPDLHDRPTIIVPVPTNYFRRLTRGTDHSLNLARGVARELRLPLRKLLSRARRPEQARLSATARLTNLRDSMTRARLDPLWTAMKVTEGTKWPNQSASARIILVDDISTTGATMGESCRAARKIGKGLQIQDLEIVAATVCRTEEQR
jgi:predicted amidophosphoribosyltransferase